MKIHTTQNLNLFRENQPTSTTPAEFRSNYSVFTDEKMYSLSTFGNGVSFKAKKPSKENATKFLAIIKKRVGEVLKEPNPQVKKGDKLLQSSFFNKLTEYAEWEPVIQAAMAAVICMVFRPLTILSFPTKKNKEDNIYSAGHSISSGAMGLISTVLLTTPFKAGSDYVMKKMLKDLDADALKRLFPHLDEKSIWADKAKGIRTEVEKWLDLSGNKFSQEFKDVAMLSEFKQLADVSEVTFEKILGVTNVDWAIQKGKSFNDVLTRDGKKLAEIINMDKLGIVVKEKGFNDAQILFKDMDKKYFEQLCKDLDWKIDINSVYKDGKMQHFKDWKKVTGEKWKLDLDKVFVSSPFETADYMPRITGKKRFDQKEQIWKFVTYQKNNGEGNLGTEISKDMVNAAAANEIHIKLLTWLPDLLSRVPVALGTTALLPIVLKNVFHLEKSKPAPVPALATATATAGNLTFKGRANAPTEDSQNNEVTFKGKGDPGWFSKAFGKFYGKPLIESKWVHELSEKLTGLPGTFTTHMATLGAMITSGVYVARTLTNDKLEPERRRTLGINQVLCFIVPTIAAYTVDSLINGWVKNNEYRFGNLQRNDVEKARLLGKEVPADFNKKLGTKLKGVRLLASLATFTLIYRYATPVIITPVANWIGDKINANKKAKAETKQAKVAA